MMLSSFSKAMQNYIFFLNPANVCIKICEFGCIFLKIAVFFAFFASNVCVIGYFVVILQRLLL